MGPFGARCLVESAASGKAILDISGAAEDEQALSLSGGGRAPEYPLTKRVTFALHEEIDQ